MLLSFTQLFNIDHFVPHVIAYSINGGNCTIKVSIPTTFFGGSRGHAATPPPSEATQKYLVAFL